MIQEAAPRGGESTQEIELLRRLAAQAESLGDRATRYLYEGILLSLEERAYHNSHFLEADSLKAA